MIRLSIRWVVAALVVAVALTGALVASRPSQAGAVINVNTTDDESNDDGDCSLREASQALSGGAVDACPAGNAINIPAGTYVLTMGQIDIFYNGSITGAGAGSTIIDGNEDDRVFYLSSKGGPITVTMTGLTVQNGFAEESDGGGIYVEPDVTLTLNDSVVQNNTAEDDGGGIVLFDGTVTLNNTTVSGNFGEDGGGVYNEGPDTLIVNDSVITDNEAEEDGGGMKNNFDAGATMSGSTVSGNHAGEDGGGISNDQCCGIEAMVITDSVISGNTANSFGGGIENTDEGGLDLTNVTISGNSATAGGGISNDFGTSAELTNVTVTDNSSESGGGIYTGDDVTLANTIVAANSPENCLVDLKPTGDLTSLGHNLEDTDTCNLTATGDQPNTDPVLGALADNGGPTQTHALVGGSSAIDTADDGACPDADQRGVARPQDGDDDGTAVCDIGAFELEGAAEPTPTEPPDGNPNVDVTVSDDTPEVGDTVDISVNVTDDAGNPIAGVECAFEITSQPGDDAVLEAETATTDENGTATVGLSVGNTPGTVEVTADCGDFGSEVLEVTVGAAGLPPTGAGGTDGSSSDALAVILAALAAGATLIGAGFALRRG
ncbi:MAG: choice-of-anchor Q domain-containing protein [Dehalococcoidia bacterium]